MERRFGKNDVILLAVMVFAVLGFLIGMTYLLRQGERVVITVEGEVYGSYRLSDEQNIEISKDGKVVNIVRIEDNKVYMYMADCPDHLCQRQGAVHREGESIICLPNRVAVTVRGADRNEDSIDAIAR